MNVIIDQRTGYWWAAQLELEVGYWWRILWEPTSQHLTAYYRGRWEVGGFYHKGHTPKDLWPLMRETQHEGRRRALVANAPVPPVLEERLPDALWRAEG
ncbi:hypothetical protein ABZ897_04070 [Nonomuraea sp. NPDC046802]|uniref:hypothetical protein n=1 Tax=Nonomuraea sp. NPDC046802 TaxID=3154919 RepID=UPI00340D8228